jgi:hypothetical protein
MKNKNKNIDFTPEEIFDLISQPCFYCGLNPESVIKTTRGMVGHKFLGLDRINSLYGYHKGNVIPCCRFCNFAKHDRTLEDFAIWAEAFIKNFDLSGISKYKYEMVGEVSKIPRKRRNVHLNETLIQPIAAKHER